MGPIYDRTREHLGTTDTAIIRTRKHLLDAARALAEDGAPPPGVEDSSIYSVRGAAALIPRGADWIEATREMRMVIPGENPSAPPR
jgi:hypothetical protein